jgi:uncharacterized protein YciI
MYFILFYETVDDYVELRKPYREEHLKLAGEARESGKIIMAGALAEPADGAVLIFKCESAEEVENFATNDPYVKNGLIRKWSVRPWTVVIGGD